MWEGLVTEELKELFRLYDDKFGCDPDEYAEIYYDGMSYDEFVGYIKECLSTGKEIPDVVE